MKKRIMLAISVIFVLSLAIAAFAFNNTATNSCPLKKQTETSAQTVDMKNVTVATSAEDCCEKGAACCNGGACCKKKS